MTEVYVESVCVYGKALDGSIVTPQSDTRPEGSPANDQRRINGAVISVADTFFWRSSTRVHANSNASLQWCATRRWNQEDDADGQTAQL